MNVRQQKHATSYGRYTIWSAQADLFVAAH